MKVKRIIKTTLAGMAAMGALAGVLLLLSWFREVNEKALFSQQYLLELPPDEPTLASMEIPLINTLWDYEKYYKGSEIEWENMDEQYTIYEYPYTEMENELIEAGVLPSDFARKMEWMGYEYYVTSAGKSLVDYGEALVFDGEKVVRYYAGIEKRDSNFDVKKAAQNYVAYLQLDGLGDWEIVEEKNKTEGVEQATMYSVSSQLLVSLVYESAYEEADFIRIEVMSMKESKFRTLYTSSEE